MPLRYDPDALEPCKKAPKKDLIRLKEKVSWLWSNRSAINHLPLSANLAGFYKYRVGKYRVIYIFDPISDDMVIRLIGLRDTVYRLPSD